MDDIHTRVSLAPVCFFAYNRIDNTRKSINALKQNRYARNTDVFVFSDGGRDKKSWNQVNEVRSYLREVCGFKSFTVIERPENYYIERNITEGLTEVINKYGHAIIVEDDVVTGKNFLLYMNRALNYYKNRKRIMHISAFCFINIEDFGQTVLWKYSEGYGWATWRDRWDMFIHYQTREEALYGLSEVDINTIELDGNFKCLQNLNLSPIPWDICWYITIIKNNGLCLTPTVSLVKNIGLYKGTHFSTSRFLGKSYYDTKASDVNIKNFPSKIEDNYKATERLKYFYKNAHFGYNYFGSIYNILFNLLKIIYRLFYFRVK